MDNFNAIGNVTAPGQVPTLFPSQSRASSQSKQRIGEPVGVPGRTFALQGRGAHSRATPGLVSAYGRQNCCFAFERLG